MTWARIDDNFPLHPKVMAAGPICELIQVRAICYSCRFLTDGLIDPSVVPALLTNIEGAGAIYWASRMVDAGLWHRNGTGYRVHDFLAYNPSKKLILRRRKDWSKAGKKSAIIRWGTTKVKTDDTARLDMTLPKGQKDPNAPVPSPSPSPSPSPTSTPPSPQAGIDADLRAALDRLPRFRESSALYDAAWWQAMFLAYPAVDHVAELADAHGWLLSDKRGRTYTDMRKFLRGWFKRAQQGGGA